MRPDAWPKLHKWCGACASRSSDSHLSRPPHPDAAACFASSVSLLLSLCPSRGVATTTPAPASSLFASVYFHGRSLEI
ncbi:hypothetical protein NL676_038742 [Syzygium grande]|nr:hypothetical protein NL676_038742 [Syzygium grande]